MSFLRCPLAYQFAELGLPERAAARADAAHLSGTALGNAVHEALEHARFDADPAEEVVRLAPTAGPVRTLVEAALRSPIAQEIRAAVRVLREVPFYAPLNGSVLHGIIDLTFQDAAGYWHIVDWKSNAVGDPTRLASLIHHYTLQLQLYAAALSAVPGLGAVATARLVFVQTGEVASVPIDTSALEAARGAAWAAAVRIGARDFVTTAGSKCLTCGYRKGGWCTVGRSVTAHVSATA
jgi:hypothetical protein